MENKKIFIFTGLTCAGKDTCQNILAGKYNLSTIVSTTSRPIRPGEVDGVNYHYVDNATFENMIKNNEMVEYRKYNTLVDNIPAVWYYGVEKKEISDNSKLSDFAVVLDSTGYDAFKALYGDDVIMCWVKTSYLKRKHRCKLRGDYNKYEFRRRNKSDLKRFKDLPKKADYIINNNHKINYLDDILDGIYNYERGKK